MFVTLFLPSGCSSLSLSFLFLPLASLSLLPNVADALAVAPALCAPARVARAMASDFHANVNVAAGSCQACSLLAGPRLLPLGGLCQRGVETQAVTPSCPITRTPSSRCAGFASLRPLSLFLSSTHSLSLSLSLSHAFTRITCPLSFLTLPLLFPPPPRLRLRLRLRLLLLFILSSSSLYFLPPLLLHLRFFFWVSFFLVVVVFSFVSALANPCWL